jgi:hypothetical protein
MKRNLEMNISSRNLTHLQENRIAVKSFCIAITLFTYKEVAPGNLRNKRKEENERNRLGEKVINITVSLAVLTSAFGLKSE